MKRMSLTALAVFLLGSIYCFADTQLATAEIPFSFIVEGKAYPAGSYRFSANDMETVVTVQNAKASQPVGLAVVVTRLAGQTGNNAEVIFDVVGNDHYLSELYIPNMDGYYFKSAHAKHTHVTIKGTKTKS